MIRQDPKYNEQYGKLLRFAKFVQLTGIKVTKEDYVGSHIVDFVKLFFFLTKCILRSIIVPFIVYLGSSRCYFDGSHHLFNRLLVIKRKS